MKESNILTYNLTVLEVRIAMVDYIMKMKGKSVNRELLQISPVMKTESDGNYRYDVNVFDGLDIRISTKG